MSMNEEIKDPLLTELVHCFYKGNLNFFLEQDDIQRIDWEWQQLFLDLTFNSPLIKQYPVSSQYSKLFLKKVIKFLEPVQEVHDDLYAKLCIAMKQTSQDGFCYRHYIIGKSLSNIVTIKETRNMVVNGTTGLKTWEAALMLSDWALHYKNKFENKNVLELGAGVGFAGITIGRMTNVKSLILTDCHDEVLKTINENIEINFTHFQKKKNTEITFYEGDKKSIGMMMLDWNEIEYLKGDIVPDIIIGADIVYDPSILEPLCNVIQTFCLKNKLLEVYIASVIRNEETFDKFLVTLDTKNFIWEKIELAKSEYIEWDESIPKCLLKIKLKS